MASDERAKQAATLEKLERQKAIAQAAHKSLGRVGHFLQKNAEKCAHSVCVCVSV